MASRPQSVPLRRQHDGGRDTLRADGVGYVERLRAAGVDVTHDETPGADHYFLSADLVRARSTMAMVAAEVRRRLEPRDRSGQPDPSPPAR